MKNRMRTALVAVALGAALTLSGCTPSDAERGLPTGMPESVSVGDGTVSNAVTSKKSWSFVLTVADDAAQKAALAELKDTGFVEVGTNSSDTARTYALRNKKDGTNATLVLTKRSGKPVVVFNIVAAG